MKRIRHRKYNKKRVRPRILCTVVNVHTCPTYDVSIMRPRKWGNPFKITTTRNRRECVRLFFQYFTQRKDLMLQARQELSGKIIGCCCKPKLCHGDIIAKIVNMTDVEFARFQKKLENRFITWEEYI